MVLSGLRLEGIFPPIPTPFDRAGAIDATALHTHLRFLEAFDLRGYVVLGSNGEAVHLDLEERIRMLELARERIPGGRLMIAGTGCLSTAETIKLSKRAAAVGADAALVLPPYYYRGRMTAEALKRHFYAVAEACTIPVIIYNMPACTGIDLAGELICALSEHPNVIGLKDSGGDVVKLGAVHHALGTPFQILAGSAGFLLPALSVGAVGGVLALANVAPAQCLEIWASTRAGHWDRAREVQLRMIEPNAAVTRRWGVAGLKAALRMVGSEGGYVRPPLLELANADVEALREILTDARVLAYDAERSS